ncbi:hypothetical protein PYW07_013040 [Mythimna separata]|uniref:Uncharacterized protein n=1 Tax=Mythimna separata TaxID=271217 RepID=A0AAD7Y5M5_MYTSE|nr:hypothetical protein PYW07_013040 [Mythimna separata]
MNGTTADGEAEEDPRSAIRINMMPPKIRLNRDIIFTLEDLFASLGGTTALFVGASVLTVVETVLFILRHLVRLVIRRRRGRVVDFKP